MVFRWLFGGSTEATPATEESPSSEDYVETAEGDTTTDGTPTPVVVPIPVPEVPLTAIPSFMVDDRPELKLSAYSLKRSMFAANVLALTHNAVRLEMADMWGDILPSLQSRCESTTAPLDGADAMDVRSWWAGFARFALTTSLVDDMVWGKAFGDVHVGFIRETQGIEKQYLRVVEKNNVYLEMAVKKMAKAVDGFETEPGGEGFTELVKAWSCLAGMLADIYAEGEALIVAIDKWIREPFEYKELEKAAARMFTCRKRWGEEDGKRGEMVVILCRWVGTEELMREWMCRNLSRRELRSIDRWMDDYRDKRLAIIDRFHQKKV